MELSNEVFDKLMAQYAELRKERDAWKTEAERLRKIEQAARDLDEHREEGYATLVSYLIRLHDTLAAYARPMDTRDL